MSRLPRPAYVLTGVTSGFGLRIATRLAHKTGGHLVAGARSPDTATALQAAVPAGQLTLLPLDLRGLASSRRFADAAADGLRPGERIAGVICNAGIQLIGPKSMTADGLEATFATNHLGHFLIVQTLLPKLDPGGVVVTTGSATHDPDDRLARMFGFRGAVFPGAGAVARGELGRGGTDVQQGLDRYATSKLCNILFARDMAARTPGDIARFFCFDPGLMPGTELARQRSAAERFGWKRVMPLLRFVHPGVSTPSRSATALVDELILDPSAHPSGSYVDVRGRPAPRSRSAEDASLAAELHDESARLVADALETPAAAGSR